MATQKFLDQNGLSTLWNKIKGLTAQYAVTAARATYAASAGYAQFSASAGYAATAGNASNADKLDGYHASYLNNAPWGTIPVISTTGYFDIGMCI